MSEKFSRFFLEGVGYVGKIFANPDGQTSLRVLAIWRSAPVSSSQPELPAGPGRAF